MHVGSTVKSFEHLLQTTNHIGRLSMLKSLDQTKNHILVKTN